MTNVAEPVGFIRYSRGVAVSRLALVACFVGLLAIFTPWPMAVLGGLEFALYFALLVATEVAARQADLVKASRRLRWQSDVLMFLLVANACWLAIQIRLYGDPIMQVEAALLTICVLLFAALRFHMSRISYFIGVAPPAATLVWIAVDWSRPLAPNHYALATLLFVVAVLLVTWRQQATDRNLNQAMRALACRNAALARATEAARAASRAKTDLLAVASHEIRTPLNAVLGFAEALKAGASAADRARLVEGILDGGHQLTRLLDGVLNLAGPEEGEARLSLGPADLRRMIASVMRVWEGRARSAGLAFDFEDADPALAYAVTTDAARVEQTLVTLVSNAMGATPPGGRVTVRLSGAVTDGRLSARIEVSDTGPPISPEDRARMFEAFDQTARGRHQSGGGLGLAICARNLALLGGRIGVEPATPDWTGGAVFWFAFEAPLRSPVAAAPRGEAYLAGPIRVLAAEDNAANRSVLAALLETVSVTLVFAEDGAQAVAAWRAQAFDLVLMDANMPVMDGRQAVREIRAGEASGRRTAIWMLTANASDEDIANYLADGADGVLRKPVDVTALFDLLARIAEDAHRG